MDLPSLADIAKIRSQIKAETQKERLEILRENAEYKEGKKLDIILDIQKSIKSRVGSSVEQTYHQSIRVPFCSNEENLSFCQDIAAMINIHPGYQAYCQQKNIDHKDVELTYILP